MVTRTISYRIIVTLAALMISGNATAQDGPTFSARSSEIAVPRDTPYPGAIHLEVDATDTVRLTFNVRETIPVKGGERITLLYPNRMLKNPRFDHM